MTALSVLIPAHDEAAYLPACLEAVFASEPVDGGAELIVIANGCADATAQIARDLGQAGKDAGWPVRVLDLAEGGKLNALNVGEAAATGRVLAYLDADVRVSPPLMARIATALAGEEARYASGVPVVTGGADWVTRSYTRFWQTTPFMTQGVPGFGIFAMNRAGRARWGDWPDIISDDTFARLQFAPKERQQVSAPYEWPMIEGFANLVRVRRRQDAGVAEVAARYPKLLENEDPTGRAAPLWARALKDPAGFAAYLAVRLTTRLPVLRSADRWARGR